MLPFWHKQKKGSLPCCSTTDLQSVYGALQPDNRCPADRISYFRGFGKRFSGNYFFSVFFSLTFCSLYATIMLQIKKGSLPCWSTTDLQSVYGALQPDNRRPVDRISYFHGFGKRFFGNYFFSVFFSLTFCSLYVTIMLQIKKGSLPCYQHDRPAECVRTLQPDNRRPVDRISYFRGFGKRFSGNYFFSVFFSLTFCSLYATIMLQIKKAACRVTSTTDLQSV